MRQTEEGWLVRVGAGLGELRPLWKTVKRNLCQDMARNPLGLLLMWRLWWTVVRVAWPVDSCAWSVGHGIPKTEELAPESADSTNEELQAPPPGSTHTRPDSAKTQFSIPD